MAKLIVIKTARTFKIQANLLRRNGKLPKRVLPTFKILEFPGRYAA